MYLHFANIRTDLSGFGLGCETSAEPEKQKPSDSGKAANEGIQRVHSASAEGAGLILLFDGEAGPASAGPRRAQLDRYPDFGLEPRSPPSQCPAICGTPVAWWEFVSRHSGAT